MLKTKLATLSIVFPLLTACGGNALQVKSENVSNEKIDEIIANIESLYPDADKELKQHILEVAVKSIDDMVFIEGGSFMMGDFKASCEPVDIDHLIWSPSDDCVYSNDASYLHKVTLSNYSLSKYETTYFEFDAFKMANNLPVLRAEERIEYPVIIQAIMNKPTPIKKWQEAKDYCTWVAKLTDLPFDLPTEAQWEYAARNRGKNIYYATNDGFIRYLGGSLKFNNGTYREYTKEEVNYENDYQEVGLLPPSPLGLYDMTGNASEVVNDWYSPNYYKISPKNDPQGPKIGTQKSLRDLIGDFRFVTSRGSFSDQPEYYVSYGFRCALQQATSLDRKP
ncbi:hypothetical protein OA92_08115 [Marinomonas sp. SBI22]|uniref:formylglycine-generating enzyme family protein n=1 Tax=unclassified Marinomonas TaxID=196814 RepID=UPI0007AFD0E9|nr:MULTISPECIES: SUMF1/EgtB/PvdO family nonheme iron enzyme [unclassified Marinomonas]KZM43646.1 hypothetical protein OA92_08115 [Marinomonas sp. SBI22]KZM47208.1 hypothetical protein OA91_01495 [Marinomonas sp. SBI8L]